MSVTAAELCRCARWLSRAATVLRERVSDGVMLRARSADADRQRELEAVTVNYADQPANLFEVPAGYQKLEMPNMPPGMNMGPHGGGPGGQPGR